MSAAAGEHSLWRDAYQRFRRHTPAVVATWVLLVVAIACAVGPRVVQGIWGYSVASQDLPYGAQGPSWQHLFGTDLYGRDLLCRVLAGGQISMLVGLPPT